MVQHLKDSMFSILILFVLENFLYRDFFTSGTIDPEVNDAKGTLPSDPIDLILGSGDLRAMSLGMGECEPRMLIGFSLQVFF